jgi:hypothetical protein
LQALILENSLKAECTALARCGERAPAPRFAEPAKQNGEVQGEAPRFTPEFEYRFLG